MRTLRSARLLVLGLAAIALVGLAVSVYASSCPNLRDNGFKATVNTSIYTGPPPIPVCLKGANLIEVQVTVKEDFGFGSASASTVVCGVLGETVSFNLLGATHTFSLSSGTTWQDVYDGRCDAIDYEAN